MSDSICTEGLPGSGVEAALPIGTSMSASFPSSGSVGQSGLEPISLSINTDAALPIAAASDSIKIDPNEPSLMLDDYEFARNQGDPCDKNPSPGGQEMLDQKRDSLRELICEQCSLLYHDIIEMLSDKQVSQSCLDTVHGRFDRLRSQATTLFESFPSLQSELVSRLKLVQANVGKLEALSRHDSSSSSDETGSGCSLSQVRRWLQASEARLTCIEEEKDFNWYGLAHLETKLKVLKELQYAIEREGGALIGGLQRHLKVYEASPLVPHTEVTTTGGGASGRRRLLISSLERRWHVLWIRALEWQCRLEQQIKRIDAGLTSASDCEAESGEPVFKRQRLDTEASERSESKNSVPGSTSSISDIAIGSSAIRASHVYPEVNFSDTESHISDTLPFAETEYEKITASSSTQSLHRYSYMDGMTSTVTADFLPVVHSSDGLNSTGPEGRDINGNATLVAVSTSDVATTSFGNSGKGYEHNEKLVCDRSAMVGTGGGVELMKTEGGWTNGAVEIVHHDAGYSSENSMHLSSTDESTTLPTLQQVSADVIPVDGNPAHPEDLVAYNQHCSHFSLPLTSRSDPFPAVSSHSRLGGDCNSTVAVNRFDNVARLMDCGLDQINYRCSASRIHHPYETIMTTHGYPTSSSEPNTFRSWSAGSSPSLERRLRIESSPSKNFYKMSHEGLSSDAESLRKDDDAPGEPVLSEDSLYVYGYGNKVTHAIRAEEISGSEMPKAAMTDSLTVNVDSDTSASLKEITDLCNDLIEEDEALEGDHIIDAQLQALAEENGTSLSQLGTTWKPFPGKDKRLTMKRSRVVGDFGLIIGDDAASPIDSTTPASTPRLRDDEDHAQAADAEQNLPNIKGIPDEQASCDASGEMTSDDELHNTTPLTVQHHGYDMAEGAENGRMTGSHSIDGISVGRSSLLSPPKEHSTPVYESGSLKRRRRRRSHRPTSLREAVNVTVSETALSLNASASISSFLSGSDLVFGPDMQGGRFSHCRYGNGGSDVQRHRHYDLANLMTQSWTPASTTNGRRTIRTKRRSKVDPPRSRSEGFQLSSWLTSGLDMSACSRDRMTGLLLPSLRSSHFPTSFTADVLPVPPPSPLSQEVTEDENEDITDMLPTSLVIPRIPGGLECRHDGDGGSATADGTDATYEWDDYKPRKYNEYGPVDEQPVNGSVFDGMDDDFSTSFGLEELPHSKYRMEPIGMSRDSESELEDRVDLALSNSQRHLASILERTKSGNDSTKLLKECLDELGQLQCWAASVSPGRRNRVRYSVGPQIRQKLHDLLRTYQATAAKLRDNIQASLQSHRDAHLSSSSSSSSFQQPVPGAASTPSAGLIADESQLRIHAELQRLGLELNEIFERLRSQESSFDRGIFTLRSEVVEYIMASENLRQRLLDYILQFESKTFDDIEDPEARETHRLGIANLTQNCREAIGLLDDQLVSRRRLEEVWTHFDDLSCQIQSLITQTERVVQQCEEPFRDGSHRRRNCFVPPSDSPGSSNASAIAPTAHTDNIRSNTSSAKIKDVERNLDQCKHHLRVLDDHAQEIASLEGPLDCLNKVDNFGVRLRHLRRRLNALNAAIQNASYAVPSPDSPIPDDPMLCRDPLSGPLFITEQRFTSIRHRGQRKMVSSVGSRKIRNNNDHGSIPQKEQKTCSRRLWRVMRTSWPIQICLLLLLCLGMFYLRPICCNDQNNLLYAWGPHLDYVNGAPPS